MLRNRPAAGHYRGLADPPSTFSIQRRSRCSATLMGFRALCPSQLCSGGDLAIAFRRVFSTSVVTLPRAVEPRATRDVFDVRHRCRGPAGVIDGHGPIFFKLRLLGFGPAGQPFSSIAAAPPRLGYEGPRRFTNRFCLGLVLFQVLSPSNPGSPLLGPIRSWALSSRRSAGCATASGAFAR